jgi:hypothetical protein
MFIDATHHPKVESDLQRGAAPQYVYIYIVTFQTGAEDHFAPENIAPLLRWKVESRESGQRT